MARARTSDRARVAGSLPTPEVYCRSASDGGDRHDEKEHARAVGLHRGDGNTGNPGVVPLLQSMILRFAPDDRASRRHLSQATGSVAFCRSAPRNRARPSRPGPMPARPTTSLAGRTCRDGSTWPGQPRVEGQDAISVVQDHQVAVLREPLRDAAFPAKTARTGVPGAQGERHPVRQRQAIDRTAHGDRQSTTAPRAGQAAGPPPTARTAGRADGLLRPPAKVLEETPPAASPYRKARGLRAAARRRRTDAVEKVLPFDGQRRDAPLFFASGEEAIGLALQGLLPREADIERRCEPDAPEEPRVPAGGAESMNDEARAQQGQRQIALRGPPARSDRHAGGRVRDAAGPRDRRRPATASTPWSAAGPGGPSTATACWSKLPLDPIGAGSTRPRHRAGDPSGALRPAERWLGRSSRS